MIYIISAIFFLYISVIAHEGGHLLMAKFLNFKVARVEIGGDAFRVKGTNIYIGFNPFKGKIIAFFSKQEKVWKRFLIYSSGPILETLVLSVFCLFSLAFLPVQSFYISVAILLISISNIISGGFEEGHDLYEIIHVLRNKK